MDPTPSAGGTDSTGVPGGGLRDVVQLTLPAASAYLTVLRTATASLAARLDFTLDDIEDLRIAVDEASALLLVSAVPGSSLECTFTLSPGLMRVTVSVESLDGEPPSKDTFAWTVLDALAGEVSSSTGPGQRVTIELTKRRGVRADLGEPPAGHVSSRTPEAMAGSAKMAGSPKAGGTATLGGTTPLGSPAQQLGDTVGTS